MSIPKFLTPVETAKALGVTIATLAVWRCTKRYGLRYVKSGGRVFYPEPYVLDFIKIRTRDGGAFNES